MKELRLHVETFMLPPGNAAFMELKIMRAKEWSRAGTGVVSVYHHRNKDHRATIIFSHGEYKDLVSGRTRSVAMTKVEISFFYRAL